MQQRQVYILLYFRPQLKFLFEQLNVSLFRKTSQIIQNLSGQEIEEKD